MANAKKKPRKKAGQPAREDIPPGATRKALRRPLDPGGGPPGSGAGPRHAAGDPGSDIESTGRDDPDEYGVLSAAEEVDPLEQGPPYASISGGAVGGTPAQVRSSGGRIHRGIAPGGVHRGDSTIGADPHSGAE
jgi:hypothetical protein